MDHYPHRSSPQKALPFHLLVLVAGWGALVATSAASPSDHAEIETTLPVGSLDVPTEQTLVVELFGQYAEHGRLSFDIRRQDDAPFPPLDAGPLDAVVELSFRGTGFEEPPPDAWSDGPLVSAGSPLTADLCGGADPCEVVVVLAARSQSPPEEALRLKVTARLRFTDEYLPPGAMRVFELEAP